MQIMKKKTYLSRLESDYFSRRWYKRRVTLFCNLLFTGKWMRETQVNRCLVVEISEGEATVRIGKLQVPDHVYLVFGRFDVVVGSTVVEREPGVIHLSFVKQLSPRFVNRLARMTSPFSTLESLDPATISASDNVGIKTMPKPPAPDSAPTKRAGQRNTGSAKSS